MGRILIIDDEDVTRSVLREILERGGHEVVEASDGGEGLGTYSQNGIDLVITDVFMPGMSGLEVLTELLQQDPDAKVIVTAGMGEIVLEQARALGAAATLPKPCPMQEVLDTVRGLLIETTKGVTT